MMAKLKSLPAKFRKKIMARLKAKMMEGAIKSKPKGSAIDEAEALVQWSSSVLQANHEDDMKDAGTMDFDFAKMGQRIGQQVADGAVPVQSGGKLQTFLEGGDKAASEKTRAKKDAGTMDFDVTK